jgi:hypothetical protein
MKTQLSSIAVAIALSVASFGASATPLLITGGDVQQGDCTFACLNHYQQSYDAAAFGVAPVSISSVSYFTSAYGGEWAANNSWQISLSTGARKTNDLLSSFSANLGTDNAVFEVKSFSGHANPYSAITFDGTFNYDPTKGDLLVDIVALGNTGGPTVEYSYNSQGAFSRNYQWGSNPNGYLGEDYGNVTSFEFNAAKVPEPASFMLLGLGLIGLGMARRKSTRA